ncbi:hypothetical protein QJQ45_006066 [Haematococcus lacustris]|nr:hypothetical protein QJQ45_006066 [Haematococcus lacustris]
MQELSLPDIKTRFRRHSLAATLQCAGNRRSEMSRVKPVRGLSWDTGAVGTAIWSGALLRDVLLAAGLQEGEVGPGHHVHFIGLDTNTDNGQVYEVSVPAAHVLDPRSSVLLAHEMNGQPLTRDHGFPLRVVLPGIVGARNVKWLGHVMLSETECQGQWQQRDYKAFAPSVDWHNVDWGAAPAIHDCPVQSAITSPLPAARVKLSGAGGLPVRGWAWSGGGRSIIRVDVSADGGSSWTTASLAVPPTPASHAGSESRDPGNAAWAWTLWQAEVPVPNNSSVGSQVSLVVKATDSAYNSQPDDVRNIWNLRGVVNNAWHRLPVTVE